MFVCVHAKRAAEHAIHSRCKVSLTILNYTLAQTPGGQHELIMSIAPAPAPAPATAPTRFYVNKYLGVSAANPSVAFYNIHGRKGEVIFFCSVPDTILDV
jgi:hypothetical protein